MGRVQQAEVVEAECIMPVHNLQPVSALVAGSILLGAVAWWAFSSPALIDPGRPKWKGAEIDKLVASVPEIDKFGKFYVNDDNPFVPYNLRLVERGVYDARSRGPRGPRPPITTPPVVARVKPPRPPVDVVEQPRPKLVLPKLSPAPADAPIVFGFVGSGSDQALLVRMPKGDNSIRMVPGDKAQDWTLVAVDNGNIATFLDPRGLEHRFSIGEGDLAAVPEGSENDTAPAAPNKSDKSDKNNKPVLPKIDQKNVPRPLPLPERKPRPEKKPDKRPEGKSSERK